MCLVWPAVCVSVCVYRVHLHLLRECAQPPYWLDQEQPGSTGQQGLVSPSNYYCLGIVVVLDLETERLSFQEGKEYKQQQSMLENNMGKINNKTNKNPNHSRVTYSEL